MHSASKGDIARARGLRNNLTDAEARLWLGLRCEQMDGFRFRRQVPIGRYVVDFICFSARLVVEVDGGQHIGSSAQDAQRTNFLQSRGFYVLRFWNNDVLREPEAVIEQIRKALQRRESAGRSGRRSRNAAEYDTPSLSLPARGR